MFCHWIESEEPLARAARVAVEEVLRVKEQEKVLILTNPNREVGLIALAVYDAVLNTGGRPALMFQQEKSQFDFAEDAVIEALSSEPDVVILLSKLKLGKDKKRIKKPFMTNGKKFDHIFSYLLEGVKRIRSFYSPGITREIFIKTVPVDYKKMKSHCMVVKQLLDEAEEINITTALGTDITIGARNRTTHTDDGDFSTPGTGGNLPAGEAFISPELGSAFGTIVFDGSMDIHDRVLIPVNPITVRVEGGFVTEIVGGEEADKLAETIRLAEEKALSMEEEGRLSEGEGKEYAKNARNLGELGIGLNPSAEIVGNMLVDEKVFKTCHIALGSNYDRDARSLIHLDGLIRLPTIKTTDSTGKRITIMKDGELVL
ncbi:MAG: peptidase M17 [Spirochaetes bacterium]|nr:MAG: peptidase M17 [Spirochaetota bacterium]